MSCKLVNRIAPSRCFRKTGVNIYTSSDGAVEADVIFTKNGRRRHAVVTFRWPADGLEVKGHMFDSSKGVYFWTADKGGVSLGLAPFPKLPSGNADFIWCFFILIMAA